jgi:hypothetical protein
MDNKNFVKKLENRARGIKENTKELRMQRTSHSLHIHHKKHMKKAEYINFRHFSAL